MKGSDIMRTMPQFEPTDGYQFAGSGLDSGGGGGGGGGSSIAFSTDEFETGMTWIDGKSIYGKVVTGFAANNSSTSVNNAVRNIDSICFYLPVKVMNEYNATGHHIECGADVKKSNLNNIDVTINNSSGTANSYVIVFYTK